MPGESRPKRSMDVFLEHTGIRRIRAIAVAVNIEPAAARKRWS